MLRFPRQFNFSLLISWLIFSVVICITTSCQSKQTSNKELSSKPEKSWTLGPFVKVDSVNPVLASGDLTFLCPILNEEVAWEAKDVFNPAAVVKDGKINLLYRAEDFLGKNNGTSRIGLARSEDGLQFEKRSSPVFYPEKDYEIEGQINHVCFIEGMVPYKGNWFLYYGTADSKIAVSVCKL